MASFLEEEKRKAMFNEVVSAAGGRVLRQVRGETRRDSSPSLTACLSRARAPLLETGQVIMGRIQRMQ